MKRGLNMRLSAIGDQLLPKFKVGTTSNLGPGGYLDLIFANFTWGDHAPPKLSTGEEATAVIFHQLWK